MIKYTYKGNDYYSLWEVRRASQAVFSDDADEQALKSLGIIRTTLPDPEPEKPSLEQVKAQKYEEIKEGLEIYRKTTTLMSSLGFEIDATERSLVDVQGLIALNPPEGKVIFRDANNDFHQIDVKDLRVLEKEIYARGLEGYTSKWKLDKAVEEAKTVEEVEAIEVKYV